MFGWSPALPPSHPLLLLLPACQLVRPEGIWLEFQIPPHWTGQAGQQLAHFAVAASTDKVACFCKMMVKREAITTATTTERKSLLGFSPSTVDPPCSLGKCLGFWDSRQRQSSAQQCHTPQTRSLRLGRRRRRACQTVPAARPDKSPKLPGEELREQVGRSVLC